MPKELKNISDNVMDRIHHDKLKMRPRIYFILGSVLAFAGLAVSIMTSSFLVGLVRFSLRSHGPMGQYRFEQMVSDFPWWMSVLAVLGLIAGIWLLRRYDFSYKINFKIIAIGFILAVIAAGWLIDISGVNDVWLRRGPMRGMMDRYLQQDYIRQESMQGMRNN